MSKRTGWLAELKVGDEVAINTTMYGRKSYNIGKITKITPTGRITVCGCTFDATGREITSNTWGRYSLTPITDEIKIHVRKHELTHVLDSIKWLTMDIEKLEKVIEILGIEV